MESDSELGAVVFDFVSAWSADQERGGVRPLSEYLARFRGHEEAIAREYLALQGPPSIAPAAPPPAPEAGRIGPYRIVRELGRGGQGSVFLAEDTRIARRVALKVLTPGFGAASSERLQRFRREAEVIARLEHPSLCAIYDAEVEGSTPYIAMRFVEGETLGERLARARMTTLRPKEEPADGLRFPPRDALELQRVLLFFERTARALHAAHEAGVLHRDVKPGNLAVAEEERPVILDFGLARDDHSSEEQLTAAGVVYGTPAYMSPEQLSLATGELDRRCDVYSLGVTLYEALTLALPFEAPNKAALFQRILSQPAAPARTRNALVSRELEVVLETALDKDRGRRYASALELAEDLRRLREYEPIRARPAGAWLRLARWTRRHPALAVSISGTIVSLVLGLALALTLLARERRALEFALGRHLAERCVALVPHDPALALALGIEAAEREIAAGDDPARGANYLTRSALFEALDACRLRSVLLGHPARVATDLALLADRRSAVIALDEQDDDGRRLAARVFDLESGRSLLDLHGHGAAVVHVACDPRGRFLATAAKDGGVILWDPRAGTKLAECDAGSEVVALELDRSGERLLTATREGCVCLRGTAALALALEIDAGPGGAEQALLSPDGTRIVTRAAANHPRAARATAWDALDGRLLSELGDGAEPLSQIAFAATSGHLLSVARDGTIRVFDSELSPEAVSTWELGATATAAAIDSAGRTVLAAVERDGQAELRVRDIASREVRALPVAGRKITCAAFSPGGERVATAGVDTSLWIHEVASGICESDVRTLRLPLSLSWTADGRRIALLCVGPVAQVWYTRERPDVIRLRGASPVRRAEFGPRGETVLGASDDGLVRLWSSTRAEPSPDDPFARAPGDALQTWRHAPGVRASLSADGAGVLAVEPDGGLEVSSALDGSRLGATRPCGHPSRRASFDARGRKVLALCEQGCLVVWTPGLAGRSGGAAEPGDAAASLGGTACTGGAGLELARFDRDGTRIAACGAKDRAWIWSADGGAPLRELAFDRKAGDASGAVDLAFLPGRSEIAVACRDFRLRFFDPETGLKTRNDVFVSMAARLRVAPDGERLLLLGPFGGAAAKVLEIATQQSVQAEVAHAADIEDGAFDGSGRLVVTVARDGSAHVWDAVDGHPVAQRDLGTRLLSAGFDDSSEAPRVVCSGEDGTISVWPVDPLPAARARRPRELSPLERESERRLALPLKYE